MQENARTCRMKQSTTVRHPPTNAGGTIRPCAERKTNTNYHSKIQEAFELSPQLVSEDGTAILSSTAPTNTWTGAEETHTSCYFALLVTTRTGSSWFFNAWRLRQMPIFWSSAYFAAGCLELFCVERHHWSRDWSTQWINEDGDANLVYRRAKLLATQGSMVKEC